MPDSKPIVLRRCEIEFSRERHVPPQVRCHSDRERSVNPELLAGLDCQTRFQVFERGRKQIHRWETICRPAPKAPLRVAELDLQGLKAALRKNPPRAYTRFHQELVEKPALEKLFLREPKSYDRLYLQEFHSKRVVPRTVPPLREILELLSKAFRGLLDLF